MCLMENVISTFSILLTIRYLNIISRYTVSPLYIYDPMIQYPKKCSQTTNQIMYIYILYHISHEIYPTISQYGNHQSDYQLLLTTINHH